VPALGTALYAVYDAPDGEVQFCTLEPGMVRGQVLVRDLRTTEYAAVDANRIIHLFTLDRYGESSVYPFIRLRPMVTATAVEREKARIAANVVLPPVQMALDIGEFHLATGYDAAREDMLTLRKTIPDVATVRAVMLFACISANRGNGECERIYFRLWPHIVDGSIRKLSIHQQYKLATTPLPEEHGAKGGIGVWYTNKEETQGLGDYIHAVWDWSEDFVKWWHANSKLRDRELRHRAASELGLPLGLGLTKFTFGLELLGQNVCCLDKHILGILVGSARTMEEALEMGKKLAGQISSKLQPRKGEERRWRAISPTSLDLYEKYEDMLVEGNEFYKPSDPMSYARAQWMTWEVLRGEATVHNSLFASIRALRTGKPMRLPTGYLDNLKRGAHMRWMRLRYRWIDVRGEKHVSMKAKEFGVRMKAYAKKYRSGGLKLVGNPPSKGKLPLGLGQNEGQKGNLDVLRDLLNKYGYSLGRAGREVWLSLPARSGHNYSLMVALLDEYVQTLKEFPDDFGVHSIHRAKGDLYRVYFTEAQFANDFVEVFR
jgi:hypothetical protein